MLREPTEEERARESCWRRALRLSVGDKWELLKTAVIALGAAALQFFYSTLKLGWREAWVALVSDWKQALIPAMWGLGGVLLWYLTNVCRALNAQRDEARDAIKTERADTAKLILRMRRDTANVKHAAYDAARVLRSNVVLEDIMDPSSTITLLDAFKRCFVDGIMQPPWTVHMVSIAAFRGADEFQEQSAKALIAALQSLDLVNVHEKPDGQIVLWNRIEGYSLKPEGHLLARLLRKPRAKR